MKVLLSIVLAIVLLLGNPLARAVDCVMAQTPQDEALANMPADCPMFAMAQQAMADTVSLSVADCTDMQATPTPGFVADIPVEHGAAVPMPFTHAPLKPLVFSTPVLPRPPPDYGPNNLNGRTVVLATARFRP